MLAVPYMPFSFLNPLRAFIVPACRPAVQRSVIKASRQRAQFRQTGLIVPIMFSMMLVLATNRRSSRAKPPARR